MAFCAKCGTKIEEGVRFCPNCGAQIGASTYSQSQQESAGQQGSTFHYSNQGGSSGGSGGSASAILIRQMYPEIKLWGF